MVHFTPSPGAGRDEHLAPVTFLPGVIPVDTASDPDRADGGEPTSRGAVGGRAVGRRSGADGVRESGSTDKASTRAANVSMHQLARRGMSRWELEQVLEKRGVDVELATAELDRLEGVGLLDDAALAVTLVYTQHTRRGLGRTAIAQELKRRHIDADLIADALSEIADDDELERAKELALKRVQQLSSYDDETVTRRLTGFLARKGYGSSVVRESVAAALQTRQNGVRFR
ncbi:MAG: regulatory protein RecX [Leifsonia sp.]|jgi:regulatory protein|nr:regulatory protein RecX [Leifsonia sp.]MDQ1586888.1 regulatory protein [Microbacteriaceae bacterium]